MNKKCLSAAMFVVLMTATSGTFTSCKDYDDDIDHLQEQINKTNVTLGELQALIEKGSVITSVESTAEGLTITLSNKQVYTIKNGADGVDGKDADVWKIGQDGYWYKNDQKTEWKAVGADGKDGQNGADGQDGQDGADGQDGQDGADGKDGKYYVPNAETGCFDIYQDGKKLESTQISWKPATGESMTAVYTGNELKIFGVTQPDGTKGEVTITIGKQLGSVAFVPDVMSGEVSYPTTSTPFYHLENYLAEDKYEITSKEFIPQELNKSNVVDLMYRLNPTDAYVAEEAIFDFLNRAVVTKAAGDKENLLNVFAKTQNENGSALVRATVNARALTASSQHIAALRIWNGQHPVVSDYVHITSEAIDAMLVDSVKTLADKTAEPVQFYARTKKIQNADETDAFIKQFVSLGAAANLAMKYDGSLDLSKYLGLFSDDKDEFLQELGFVGMSYAYSLPKEYKADDTQKTNQQWYVQLDGSVLSVNKANLTDGLTPAVGRTPVVRVDAFLTDNEGEKHLVASSYVKVEITETEVTPDADKADITANIDAFVNKEYHTLGAETNATMIGQMDWTEVSNVLYGKTGLTHSTFWNYYGGADNEYSVKVTVDGKTDALITEKGKANEAKVFQAEGLKFSVNLNAAATQTTNIRLDIFNKIKTENTYNRGADKECATYTVTLTIPSDNKKVKGDIVLTQKFAVHEDCTKFKYNDLYHMSSFAGKTGDFIPAKGQLVDDTWKMTMMVSEHFAKVNGQSIFEYYHTQNVKDIAFEWAELYDDVEMTTTETPSDIEIALTNPMTEDYLIRDIEYNTTLENDETCNFNYSVVFYNPFKAGTSKAVSLNDGVGEKTVSVVPQVNVVASADNQAIYSWNTSNQKLELSDTAIKDYMVAAPSVTYAFDKTFGDYQKIVGNMATGSKLAVENGMVTWKNLGAQLQGTYKLRVIATVTFADLSEVTCLIPVNLIGK